MKSEDTIYVIYSRVGFKNLHKLNLVKLAYNSSV